MAECVRDKTNIRIECQLCGKMDNLMICGGCKRTWYCGKEHQKYDWKYHKKKCKRIRPENEQREIEESGQCSINSNGMSTSIADPRVTGLRDSSVVFPTVTHDDKSMNNSKATELVFTSESVSDLQKLNLEEEKEDSSTNAVNDAAKDFFLQADIRELKPFTSESVKQNISLHSTFNNKSKAMAPTTDDDVEFDTSKTYFSVLETRTKMLADYACNCLNRYGICVIDNFLGNSKGLEILDQVKDMHQAGIFKKGQLMNSNKSSNSKHVRGDILTWVDGSEEGCQDIGFLISSMDAVVLKCAGKLSNCTVNGRTKVKM